MDVLVCACQRSGGRLYAQTEQKRKEVTLPQDRLAAPGFGSYQIGCPQ
jgi:hypothetical protein